MSDPTSKKYFCYEIYKNLAIWSRNGKLSFNPCSYYDGYIKTSDKFDLSEIWNSPEHKELKSLIQQETPIPGCHLCYKAEADGLISRRLSVKGFYENYLQDTNLDLDGPQSLDYSVGNLCNLKCVICGPANSSVWVSEYQISHPHINIEEFKHDKHNQLEINNSDLLKNIKNIHFHGGGEPLLSDNHINLLKKIKEIKGLGDVHVLYNTNGTKRASQELLDLWAECQLVELYFSIDDIRERFNYQRTGADWNEVVENLEWYKINMPVNHMFKINCTWSYLNLYYLDELVKWHRDHFYTNRLGDPIELIFQKVQSMALGFDFTIDIVPLAFKTKLQEKFKQYPQLLQLVETLLVDDNGKHERVWEVVNRLDKLRNTNFRHTFFELAKLLS
jgi:MoaA/NifB/PqqE/SkfB family radical SAM enzyme